VSTHRPEYQEPANNPAGRIIANREEDFDGGFGRHLRPRYLCVISDSREHPDGYKVVNVDEWDRTRGRGVSGGYVFVSYTRAQFQTYQPFAPTDARKDDFDLCQSMNAMFKPDLSELVAIGRASAISAGLCAFWIDMLCLGHVEAKQDSHRICDIARGCDRMVIAVKDEAEARHRRRMPAPVDALLQNWASRLWTVPELLLAPTRHDFAIYHIRANVPSSKEVPAEIISKRNMAERAYNNGLLIRQLVDHFESNLHLTQTELLTIGLECLLSRQFSAFYPADLIYALMTLARRRPIPKKDQTVFEAFAQLSLMNDSNMLFERLLCTLPPVRGTDWTHIDDFWGCKLWDIVPNIQVAAITPDDSVLIDGAFGASIEWDALRNVGFIKRSTPWRTLGNVFMRMAFVFFLIGCISLSFTTTTTNKANLPDGLESLRDLAGNKSVMNKPATVTGAIFITFGTLMIIFLPAWAASRCRGKFWTTQAHLFGLEGVADIEWLENQLFGICEGRLKWAANASTQSRHHSKTVGDHLKDECEAEKPFENPLPQIHNDVVPDHLFTLVDTYAMTVTVFRAVHPPSVALICGQEGGMRRALLCSYDYETQTFHRETVVRMPTKVLDRMDRVNKFRFSMSNRPLTLKADAHLSSAYYTPK
jgi:hypothetical protein